eukprot:scaffold2.g7168.t1
MHGKSSGEGARATMTVDTPAGSPDKPSPSSVEAQQEAMLAAKYGGLPRKHVLAKRAGSCRRHFDSADWAMKIEGAAAAEGALPGEPPVEALPAVLQPPLSPTVSRRLSNLGHE